MSKSFVSGTALRLVWLVSLVGVVTVACGDSDEAAVVDSGEEPAGEAREVDDADPHPFAGQRIGASASVADGLLWTAGGLYRVNGAWEPVTALLAYRADGSVARSYALTSAPGTF